MPLSGKFLNFFSDNKIPEVKCFSFTAEECFPGLSCAPCENNTQKAHSECNHLYLVLQVISEEQCHVSISIHDTRKYSPLPGNNTN